MSRLRPGAFRYVPAEDLNGEAHVVVDGAPRPGTVCTLSHWPATPTPRQLWADTSAEIVLRARRRPNLLPASARVATVDHYDADGVIALALLVDDALANRHAAALVGAARGGDFDVVARREDALIAFGIAAAGAERPLGEAVRCALELLPGLVERPAEHEALWGPEAGAYDAACRLRDTGDLSIAEYPALDLAVATVADDHPLLAPASWHQAPIHPAAVHSATTCLRVATVVGRRFELRFRYETWVRLVSRRPRPRVDLSALAATLTAKEADGGRWLFDGAGAITPSLRRGDGAPSTLDADEFLAHVAGALADLDHGPPAWDPYGER